MKKLLTLFFALNLSSGIAFGQAACDYIYVTPGGASNGSGNINAPVTLTHGLSLVTPTRNVILVLEGSYLYTQKISVPANVVIDGRYQISGGEWVKNSSTTTDITVQPGLETVSGTGHYIAFELSGSNNVYLKDLNITNGSITSGTTGSRGRTKYGIRVANSSNVYFTRLDVSTTNASNGFSGATGSAGLAGGQGWKGHPGDNDGNSCGSAGGIDDGEGGIGGGGSGYTAGANSCNGTTGSNGQNGPNFRHGGWGGGGGSGEQDDGSPNANAVVMAVMVLLLRLVVVLMETRTMMMMEEMEEVLPVVVQDPMETLTHRVIARTTTLSELISFQGHKQLAVETAAVVAVAVAVAVALPKKELL